jgi:predicted nucleic acid-binding protein
VRAYCDSSALVKRAVQEAESGPVEDVLEHYAAQGGAIICSSLGWVEITRALRSRLTGDSYDEAVINEAIDAALSGVAERLITEEVVGLARRVPPSVLRSLDAIHLATAILADADTVITYDDRLADACRQNGLTVLAPGR